jgi:hypothetical protein
MVSQKNLSGSTAVYARLRRLKRGGTFETVESPSEQNLALVCGGAYPILVAAVYLPSDRKDDADHGDTAPHALACMEAVYFKNRIIINTPTFIWEGI